MELDSRLPVPQDCILILDVKCVTGPIKLCVTDRFVWVNLNSRLFLIQFVVVPHTLRALMVWVSNKCAHRDFISILPHKCAIQRMLLFVQTHHAWASLIIFLRTMYWAVAVIILFVSMDWECQIHARMDCTLILDGKCVIGPKVWTV